MLYVLDTSVISTLFRNYYRERFPSLWNKFDETLRRGDFTCARESFRELEDFGGAALKWAQQNRELFVTPDATEAAFVARIYSVAHFQANVERQKLYRGGKNADPFIIARAAVRRGTVVTMEKLRPNAAKIPNICQHFAVPCVDLEKFMEIEGWTF